MKISDQLIKAIPEHTEDGILVANNNDVIVYIKKWMANNTILNINKNIGENGI